MVTAIEEDSPNTDPEEQVDAVCFAKKYKPVALKVKPVLGTLPERFRIKREIKEESLKRYTEVTGETTRLYTKREIYS